MRTEVANQIHRLYGQGRSAKEVGDLLGLSWRQVIACMQRHHIPRRSRSEATYLKANPAGDPFQIKSKLSVEEERLKALAVGLFWGEGTRRNRISVRISNSDPRLLRIFVAFLRNICGVHSSKLRVHLVLHDDVNPEEALAYWSCWLEIPRDQFNRPTSIHARGRGSYTVKARYGTAGVYVHNSKLRRVMEAWLNEYAHVAQSAERELGKFEVAGSIPAVGSNGHSID